MKKYIVIHTDNTKPVNEETSDFFLFPQDLICAYSDKAEADSYVLGRNRNTVKSRALEAINPGEDVETMDNKDLVDILKAWELPMYFVYEIEMK